MNSRGSQSSESEKFTLKEILRVFLEQFYADFSFRDIERPSKGLFTEDEIKRILSEKNEEKRTTLMFFLLEDKNKDLDLFLNILQSYYYSWHAQNIREKHRSYLEGDKELVKYINEVHELRSHFPKHADFNVHRLHYHFEVRSILKRLKTRQYLVIHGELGFGKKWLALDACCDYAVMTAMNFNIFWIDVHNCDREERDLEKLQRLKLLLGENCCQKKLGDYEGISNKILELQQELRTILREDEYKDCLLVLADVQNRKTLEAFNLPCKILITTRNKNIAEHLPRALTKTVHVSEGLTQNESIDLFEIVLNKKKSEFPSNYSDLFDQIKGHPFLLNIIAQNLKDQPKAEWNKWIKNVEHFNFNDHKINNLIQLSFNVLSPEEWSLYQKLSIFYHSIKIPVKVIASLWDMPEREAQILLKKFDKFSLVTIAYLKDETVVCILHFLYYSYLLSQSKNEDKMKLHERLVENYKIEEALASRTEVDIVDLLDDHYFYYFIGYHLREAKMEKFFPKLYLDFGFLGQKLRAAGLASTIGDLKYYREHITELDPEREMFVKSLLEFLPNIEEMMFRSSDTCLLQYALMTSTLHLQAEKQAKMFEDKIWFTDGDHFHRRRQMIKLPTKPKVLKLVEPDSCLISIDNDKMILADLSLGYNLEHTKFINSEGITTISIFLNNYVITLDLKGELRVWSIADERRRSVQRKPSSRSIESHVINSEIYSKMRTKDCLQCIDRDMDHRKDNIRTFYLETKEDYSVYLHLVFANGNINILKWDNLSERFAFESIPSLSTRMPNIRFLVKLFHRYYMILNNSGSLQVFRLSDGSSGCPMSFQWPQDTNSPINVHYYRIENTLKIIFIFPQKMLQLTLREQSLDFLNGELETLYEISDRRGAIMCSSLSEDNKYLVVGTKQGVIVFDTLEKSEMLRNSISDSITCIDIYPLDDDIYKYVIVSGAEGRNVLNIFGLKISGNSITWANTINGLVNEHETLQQFEPNCWLLGKKLFDVSFHENGLSLVAVDSKNRIHHLLGNEWSMIQPATLISKISAITVLNKKFYFGCENGEIYDSFENKTDFGFESPVIFLSLIDEDTLVGSYQNNCFVSRNGKVAHFNFAIEQCYQFAYTYLILLDKKCKINIIFCDDESSHIMEVDDIGSYLRGSDLKLHNLAIAADRNSIFIYKLILEHGKMGRPNQHVFTSNCNDTITSIALSADATLCAIGFQKGLIEVFRFDKTWKLLQNLDSHKAPIFDIKFSPWTDFSSPTILASLSEQICFWDITYALNNPMDNSFSQSKAHRHSSRFSSVSKDNTESSSRKSSYSAMSPLPSLNPWSNKKGPSTKPELLSCIKFAGNQAQKFHTNNSFTEFVTIDDEGEYYLLKIKEILSNGTSNENGNGFSYSEDDNAVI